MLRRHSAALEKRIAQAEESMLPNARPQQRKASPEEIRQYVRALPKSEERFAFLNQAVKRGDVETVAAITESHAYLSCTQDLDPKILAGMLGRAAAIARPQDVERITELRRVHDHVVQGRDAAEVPTEPASVAITRRQRAYTARTKSGLR